MNTTQIQTALNAAAASDLRFARKDGQITICQTKLGALDLSYDAATQTYTLTQCGTVAAEPKQLASGKAAAIKPTLIAAYVVS